MKILSRSMVALVVIVVAVTTNALASERLPGSLTVVVQQVRSALDRVSIQVNERQIELLSFVPVSKNNAVLRVDELKSLSPGLTRVRMRCETSAECIPFFVLVHADIRPGFEVAKPVRHEAAPDHRKELIVHSGKRAQLFLEGDNMFITLQVICLEAGSRGQIIRVVSMDRKMQYTAEILSADALKARL